MVYVAATLKDDVILVVEAAISEVLDGLATEDSTMWTTTGVTSGTKARLSGNSRFVAVHEASSTVKTQALSSGGLSSASESFLSDYYGPRTDLVDFRLSYDGTALIGVVSSLGSEITGTLFHLALSGSGNNTDATRPISISISVPNFDNRTTNIQMALDGTAIALVQSAFGMFAGSRK